jgi:hypothetical protein
MGEAFYAFLVELFMNGSNYNMGEERVVSSGLSNLGISLACLWISATLLWFTAKSVLMRRSLIVYLFAGFMTLSGISHMGHVFGFPNALHLAVEFTGTIVSLFTAFFLWQRRHFILGVIYQFKYVIGLLKTLEKLEEVEHEK